MAVTQWGARAQRFHAENKNTDWKQWEERGWDWFLSHHFWSIRLYLSFSLPRSASPHTHLLPYGTLVVFRGVIRHTASQPLLVNASIFCLQLLCGRRASVTVRITVYRQVFVFAHSHSKVTGNAMTERKREIIMVSASKHSLLPQHSNIQFAANRRCYTGGSALPKNTGTIVLHS